MQKIASPQDLQTEIQRLLAYCQGQSPSREKLSADLRGLADRVAAGPNFDDTEVWLKIGQQQIEVAVLGISSRNLQAAISNLKIVLEEADAVVKYEKPRGLRRPHLGWKITGFTVEGEPKHIRDLVKALTRVAKQLSWVNQVRVDKAWPRFR